MEQFKGLTAYVDEQRLPLIKKAVIGANTIGKINLQTGVKSQAAVNILDTKIQLGDGAKCGWNEAGTSEFSQRKIETGACKVNMSFCDKAMAKYWMGYQVKVGAGQKTLPFEEDFVEGIVSNVDAVNEKAIWQGDKESEDENLNKFNGFIKVLSTESTIKATATGAKAMVDAAYNAIPADILDRAVVFVGVDTFRAYVLELANANLYHYNPQVDGSMECVIPGTSTKVYGVAGLIGTNKVYAGDPMNFFVGVDLADDEEKFDLWYSKDNREFRLAIEYNMGVQVAFPDQIVEVSAGA